MKPSCSHAQVGTTSNPPATKKKPLKNSESVQNLPYKQFLQQNDKKVTPLSLLLKVVKKPVIDMDQLRMPVSTTSNALNSYRGDTDRLG